MTEQQSSLQISQPRPHEPPIRPQQHWFRQDPDISIRSPRDPVRNNVGIFPQQIENTSRVSVELLSVLRQNYIIQATQELTNFLSAFPVLGFLLCEAVRPIRDAFGDQHFLQIGLEGSEDGFVINAVISLPENFPNPENALREFDQHWWLENCSRSYGSLVFDYELRDGN